MPGFGRTHRGVVTSCAERRVRALLKGHLHVEAEAEHAFAELKDFTKAEESVLAEMALAAFDTDTCRWGVSTVAEEVDAARVLSTAKSRADSARSARPNAPFASRASATASATLSSASQPASA